MTEIGLDHPMVDGTTGHVAWVETLGDRVCLSEGLLGFLDWSWRTGFRPVLVTHPNGRLTYAMLHFLWSYGAIWLSRVDDGYRDQRSGRVYPTIGAVPDEPEVGDQPAPVGVEDHVWLTFSVSVQHSPSAATVVGDLVDVVWQELTGTAPTTWGWHEPCLTPWDRVGYTASAQTLMPVARMVVSGADRSVAQGVGTIRRDRDGLEEALSGVAVAGPVGLDMEGVGARALWALRQVASQIPVPVFGVVGVCHGGSRIEFGLPGTDPVMPLAVLVGPGLVETAGADVRQFAATHGGFAEGRGWAPSLVMPLFGAGMGVWDRLRVVVSEFGDGGLATRWEGAGAPTRPGDDHAD